MRARAEREPELLQHGSGFVFYALMDNVVDRYFPILDGLETELEEIEEQIFVRADTNVAYGKGGMRNLHTGALTGADPLLPYASAHSSVDLRAAQVRNGSCAVTQRSSNVANAAAPICCRSSSCAQDGPQTRRARRRQVNHV